MQQCPSFSICSFTFAAIFSVASQATNFYGAQGGFRNSAGFARSSMTPIEILHAPPGLRI
jgi:hypothetical protein